MILIKNEHLLLYTSFNNTWNMSIYYVYSYYGIIRQFIKYEILLVSQSQWIYLLFYCTIFVEN